MSAVKSSTPRELVVASLCKNPGWTRLPWVVARFHLYTDIGTLTYQELDEASSALTDKDIRAIDTALEEKG